MKLSFPFKMSHASTENDFENLLRLALPLIKNRNEPNFDRMLSKWMGRNIHTEYSNWKDSRFGSESPRDDQIRYLLAMWRKHVGEMANVRGFIEILQKAQGVSCKFEASFGKFENKKETSDEVGLIGAENHSDEMLFAKYATKIQSAYRGYYVRKHCSTNRIDKTNDSLCPIVQQTNEESVFEKDINNISDDLNLNLYAMRIQRAYRNYRSNQQINQHEVEKKDYLILESDLQHHFNSTNSPQHLNLDAESKSEIRLQSRAAIMIQSAYRGYLTRKKYNKMKQANIVFMFPECMSNVLQENTETIERFYQGYQTRKKYQKWKNAALAIQSFYRLRKRDHKGMFIEKKETASELNQTKQTAQKIGRYSYPTFLLFFALSFFLASFIVSCILISMFRINKTHHHIF